MQQQTKYKTQSGQLLIESMVSISIVVIGILSMLILLSRSASLNTKVVNRFIAAHLAGEGIEVVKNLIDQDIAQSNPWNDTVSGGNWEVDFISSSLTPVTPDAERFLKLDSATGFYSYDESGDDTIFKRRIEIAELGDPTTNEIHVSSIVEWSLKSKDFSITLEDRFFNWR